MNTFLELLEGTFSNKRQAQGHPTRFAHIRVKHVRIDGNKFYGEQAYNYLLNRPYRQFVIDVVEDGDEIRLKNYEIKDASQFVGGNNLDKLTADLLTYREGCDIIMKQTSPKAFRGGTSTCECWVMRGDVKTYVQNEVFLNETHYEVVDRGLHAESHQKVWGSDWGAFKFARVG